MVDTGFKIVVLNFDLIIFINFEIIAFLAYQGFCLFYVFLGITQESP